jgi:hypothetical protein
VNSNKIFAPFVVILLFLIGVVGFSIADDERNGEETTKIKGKINPAVAATVNVFEAIDDLDGDRHREHYQMEETGQEEFPERQDEWEEDRNVVATVEVDPETGEFEINGLEPGTYKVEIKPQDATYEKKEIQDVELIEGEEKDLGDIDLDKKEEIKSTKKKK